MLSLIYIRQELEGYGRPVAAWSRVNAGRTSETMMSLLRSFGFRSLLLTIMFFFSFLKMLGLQTAHKELGRDVGETGWWLASRYRGIEELK